MSRHEHGDVRMAFDAEGAILGRPHRPRAGRRRLPDAVAGRHRAPPSGMLFPGPYRVPAGWLRTRRRCSPTRRAARPTAGPWQFESLAREVLLDIAARRMGIDPDRAAPPQPAAARRAAVRQPERHALRRHHAARDLRAGAGDARLRRLPRASRPRRRAAGRYLGRRHLHLRRADDHRPRRLRHRGRHHPHRAVRQGQRVRRRRLDRQQPRDDRRAAHRRRARRRHRRRPHDPGRHRGDAVRRRHRRQPQRLDDSPAPSRETAAILRERIVAIAAHRLEAAAEDIELAGSRAQRARHADERAVSLAEIADVAYFQPRKLPPGIPRRPRGQRPLPGRQPDHLGQRHPRLHLRGRRRRPAGRRCSATS